MIKLNDCAFQDGSYPCGYGDGGELPDCTLCHKIRRASMKEVVEWIKSNSHIEQSLISKAIDGAIYRTILDSQWQTQKKEWGL